MEDVKNKILAILDANGGRAPYQTVIDGLTPMEQPIYPSAIRVLKAEGIAMQQNRVLPQGGVAFEVFRIGAPIPGTSQSVPPTTGTQN